VSDPPVVYPKELSAAVAAQLPRQDPARAHVGPWFGLRPKDLRPVLPGIAEPRTGLSMGESTELMVKTWGISRAEQDQLALESHQKAAAAYAPASTRTLVIEYLGLTQDNNIRADTSLEKLAKLAGVRCIGGHADRGQFDADDRWRVGGAARQRSLGARAQLAGAGVPEPTARSPRSTTSTRRRACSWRRPTPCRACCATRLTLQDFDFYEIHEAFAGQVLCTLKAWTDPVFCRDKLGLPGALGSIDRAKLNVKGGSLAIGHPFAATGTRIVATLAKILDEKKAKRGLISICTAGGMGVTAFSSVDNGARPGRPLNAMKLKDPLLLRESVLHRRRLGAADDGGTLPVHNPATAESSGVIPNMGAGGDPARHSPRRRAAGVGGAYRQGSRRGAAALVRSDARAPGRSRHAHDRRTGQAAGRVQGRNRSTPPPSSSGSPKSQALYGDVIPGPSARQANSGAAPAGGRGRGHHAVEFSGGDDHPQGGPGAGGRLHHGLQAGHTDALFRAGAGGTGHRPGFPRACST
jgi:hypothetical protein